jgi:hypothetical protein
MRLFGMTLQVVGCPIPAYLRDARRRPMHETIAPRPMSRPLVAAAAATVVLLAGVGWLWAHYGATVFFETLRAGLVACFG